MPDRKKVVIVGGGISGLSCAYHLQEGAKEASLPIDIELIEADSRLGGKIQTERREGFVLEGGPDSFITQKRWGLDLCRKLGLEERLIRTASLPKKFFLLRSGRLHPIPEGMLLMLPGQIVPFALSPIVSPLGKLRMSLDILIPRRREEGDESLGSFVRRRLGEEALEILAEPLMAGIYVADPEELSLAATFPLFLEMEKKHGSLLLAMLARGDAPRPRSDWTLFVSLREGVSELVARLSERLSEVRIRLGEKVDRVNERERRFEILSADRGPSVADALVLSTPAPVSAGLMREIDSELSRRLSEIGYVSTATVSLAFRRGEIKHPLDGFGFVVPKREKKRLLACTFNSSKFPERAPEGSVLIRGFLGGAKDPTAVRMDDEEMVGVALNELKSVLGILGQPIFSKVVRWIGANPQYRIGHLEKVAAIEAAAEKHPGLYLIGAAYRGVGIPDCIHQGARAAEKILRSFNKGSGAVSGISQSPI
jgi:oxygen-dependent protoporphyrinogen oxidase